MMNEERLSTFLRIPESITVIDIGTPITLSFSAQDDQVHVFETLSNLENAEYQEEGI